MTKKIKTINSVRTKRGFPELEEIGKMNERKELIRKLGNDACDRNDKALKEMAKMDEKAINDLERCLEVISGNGHERVRISISEFKLLIDTVKEQQKRINYLENRNVDLLMESGKKETKLIKIRHILEDMKEV